MEQRQLNFAEAPVQVLTLEEQQLAYTPGKLNSGEDAVYDVLTEYQELLS